MTNYATLAEVKAWLGFSDTNAERDAILTNLIPVVSLAIDGWTGTTFGAAQDDEEIKSVRRQDVILPRYDPIIEVTSLWLGVNADGSGGTQLAATEYNYDEVEIRLRGMAMPQQAGFLKIVYKWGYADVPATVKQATLMGVEGYWRMRSAKSVGVVSRSKEGESISTKGAWNEEAGLPKEAVSLLAQYRRIEIDLGPSAIATRNM